MYKRLSVAAVALAIAAAGCSGSDGSQGPQGVAGPNGQNGQDGATGPTGPTGPTGSSAMDGTSDDVLVSNAAIAFVGTTATMTFNIKVLGVNRNDFTQQSTVYRNHNEDAWWVYDAATRAGARTKLPYSSTTKVIGWSVASTGNGNYAVTIPNVPAAATAAGTAFMVSVVGPDGITATPVAYVGGTRAHDVVGSEACVACHGSRIFRGAKATGDHLVCNPYGVEACIVCHNRTGSADPRLPGAGSGLMGLIHGIHNSKNMSAGMDVDIDPSPAATVRNANADQTYQFTWTNGNKFNFSIGYPTYMQNCSVCHNTPARLAAVLSATSSAVSWGLCMSCHNDWNGFTFKGKDPSTAAEHRTYDLSTNCATCHTGARATIARYHNGLETERAGFVSGGQDLSVELGKSFKIAIKSVAVGAVNTSVVWNVVDPANATTYDPCNQSYASGPVFYGKGGASEGCTGTATGCKSNFAFLRAYATGDDYVANLSTLSPGQPSSKDVTTSNTSCAGFDATTVLSTESTSATKAMISLQGKPQLLYMDPLPALTTGTSGVVVWARAQSPIYEYATASGAAATARRAIVSTAKCLACHPGSLYQHGGNRVDRVELCGMCHNAASSDMQNRLNMGVGAADAYDGKAGQTYDLRTMVHAIHSAGESSVPYVVYRTRGVYLFGSPASIDAVTTWPDPTLAVTCATVAGSTRSQETSGARTTGANCDASATGEGIPNKQNHNLLAVEYPRKLSQCAACHEDGTEAGVDPAKAVAVTDEVADTSPASFWLDLAGWSVQTDDILVGPTAQSCLSCHLGLGGKTAWQQTSLKAHTAQFGWTPSATNSRQALLSGAAVETCFVCHDATKQHR